MLLVLCPKNNILLDASSVCVQLKQQLCLGSGKVGRCLSKALTHPPLFGMGLAAVRALHVLAAAGFVVVHAVKIAMLPRGHKQDSIRVFRGPRVGPGRLKRADPPAQLVKLR